MNRIVRYAMIVFVTLGCIATILFQTVQPATTTPKSPIESLTRVEIAQNIDFAPHFRELGIEGSILIYDSNRDRIFQHDPSRNTTAFLPASTFKILNSLIALETGVISDEIAVLTWDGIQRKLPAWNRDLNMREAIKLSAYWFYQVLARRVGHDRMQKWVTQVGYGNQKIGSQADIDKFWLRGELRITPEQQIQFLHRFYKNDLPFSERSLSIVKDIMVLEKTPDYTIRGKTGWVGFDDGVKPQIGWLVGYLEKGKDVYFFATNIDIRNEKDPAARMEVTRRCLKDLRLL
ncbi:class D beta-lactamase [Thermosynechococcaceae cyanobacterium BACA0444]|uniref:Beta-lactamase n=1 Tax=Pseudocalidococcus azoricus BACA0444 TaxID=2918990 RepID=A0AAE4JWJ4_9CYAN|nr:class D beta-lactamase [Pseudocalidococcus azoricus]MDS3861101.1 class D beta-lactamase [Pseudocalidococcus azoricus BACA0444]